MSGQQNKSPTPTAASREKNWENTSKGIGTFDPLGGHGIAGRQWVCDNLQILREESQETRGRFLSLLKKVLYGAYSCEKVEKTENVLQELFSALRTREKDKDGNDLWEVRAAAALMLGATRTEDSLPHLLRSLETEDDLRVKECVVLALDKIGPNNEAAAKFAAELIFRLHSIIWADEEERGIFIDSVRSFLSNPSCSVRIRLSEDQIASIMQSLAVSQPDRDGKDNWQVREAAALLLGAGYVWDSLPNLAHCAAHDNSETVRQAAFSSLLRICREYPQVAKSDLEVIFAPAKGERCHDERTAAVASRAFSELSAEPKFPSHEKIPPSVVLVPFLDSKQTMICLLRLAKGKGEAAGSHDYFHMMVAKVGLADAVRLVLNGSCVKLTERNIPYMQDVISRLSIAAFKRQGSVAYGIATSVLSDMLVRRVLELKNAKSEAGSLCPQYVENVEKRGISSGTKEDAELVQLVTQARCSGDFSSLVANCDPRRAIKAVLFSSLIEMNENPLDTIMKVISETTIETVRQRGTDAFHEIAADLVQLYVLSDSFAYNLEESMPTLQFANVILSILKDP